VRPQGWSVSRMARIARPGIAGILV
jgi:hypothetical protein